MAIRSNDARRASTKNQCDPANPICDGISDDSEGTLQVGQRNASRTTVSGAPVAGRRHRARRWLSCALSAGALGLFLSSVPGCTTTSGLAGAIGDGHCIDDFMIGYRNRALAEKAWHCQKDQFCNQQHSKEFKAGFTEGFMEVATGGNGCVPAIAPKQYWGWRYQSAQGQNAVNSWFQGYPMGVRAAEQAGVGNWGQVQTANHPGQNPQAVPLHGGANPFYGSPAGHGGVIQESDGVPALQSPEMDSGMDSGFDGPGPVDAGPMEDIIDLDFDSASTDASPHGSGFGNEPVFAAANEASVFSDTRIAELDDSSDRIGDQVDIDEVFGAASQVDSSDQTSPSGGDLLPFSFE